jgi:fructokinase
MKVALAGEALIDFVSTGDLAFQGYCGGSPMNTAIALARLGIPTGYLTQLSSDLFGRRLRQHLEHNDVDVRFVLTDPTPSTLAFVERDGAENRYVFMATGSADRRYAPEPLPNLPPETAFLHFGSVALLGEPAATTITQIVEAHRGRMVIVLDPNVRPTLIEDPNAYRARMDGWMGSAHVVKLSREDAVYLAGGRAVEAAVTQWLALGPQAVIVTDGAEGARLYRADDATDVPGFDVEVVDTIGAGDTFTAGVIASLARLDVRDAGGLDSVSVEDWRLALRFASAAAALACTRAGADPPHLDAVERFLAEHARGAAVDASA